MLKYKIDVFPISYCVAVFLLQLWGYFYLSGWEVVIFFPTLLVLLLPTTPYNHHQQHFNVFKKRIHNRIFEVILGLQTGMQPFWWVYHHNVGHHENYLNQKPEENYDESHWTNEDGTQMGRLYYSWHTVRNGPKEMERNLEKLGSSKKRSYIFYNKLNWFIWIVLFLWNPFNSILCFILPSFLMLFFTAYLTYGHHAGLYTKDHYKGNRNIVNKFYNMCMFNLGYHTAHHINPFCHWSKLPELHEKIKDKIPPELICDSFWAPTPKIVQPPEGYFSESKSSRETTA